MVKRFLSAAIARDRAIAAWLLMLAFGILIPLLVLTVVLGKLYGDAQRRIIEVERDDVTSNAVEIVDRKVAEIISALRVLAVDPDLRADDLPLFHRHAAVAARFIGEAIALLDPSGQQLVSTSAPFGTALPRRDDMRPIAAVFAGSAVEVSDVVSGASSQSPIVVISVPALRDGAVAYALTSSLSLAALSGVLAEAGMKPEWIAAIVDRHGLFIARSRDSEAFVGRLARPELVTAAASGARFGTFRNVTYDGISAANSFRRSTLTGWTIVVGVPEEMLQGPLNRVLWTILALGTTVVLLSATLALWVSRQIAKPARALSNAALTLARREYQPWVDSRVREFNHVGRMLDRASQAMHERDQTQAELQRTNTLLQTIINSTPDLIYAKDHDSRLVLCNAATLALIGKNWDEVHGRSEAEWHTDPSQAAALMANDRHVIESKQSIQIEEVFASSNGPHTYLTTKAPLYAAGTVIGLVGVSTDITERKARDEHVEFIMRELSHRSKNLLAVVQAVAQQTGRTSVNVEAFASAFEGRLAALASLHDLLIRQEWSGAPIRDLIDTQLSPFVGDKVRLNAAGPPLLLNPQAAQSISLALHELATNASKYGAWSTPTGMVTVRWTNSDSPDERCFVLTWVESGGPPVTPPQRQGFGSIVLEKMTARAFPDGTTAFDFRPEGLQWRMEVGAGAVIAK